MIWPRLFATQFTFAIFVISQERTFGLWSNHPFDRNDHGDRKGNLLPFPIRAIRVIRSNPR
jgi:hypothetical protein